MGIINGRRIWHLRVVSCYLLLIIVCLWLALCLYGIIRTTSSPWHTVDMAAQVKSPLHSRMFRKRPLIFLTLSYHAAPIYDLMDQLQPLGVQFIERGIDAYACQYFNTCRRHNPLKACINRRQNAVLTDIDIDQLSEYDVFGGRSLVIDSRSIHQFIGYNDVQEFFAVYGGQPEWQSVDAFVCLHPAATCELFIPFNRTIIIATTIRYDNGRVAVGDWKRWNTRLTRIANDERNVIAANNHYDVNYMQYYTGLTPRLLPSRCGYTRSTYNPTRPGFLLGLRRDWEFRDFFVDGINSACRALNVSVQLASIRDLYPTYTWNNLASHRGIVPLPCQPSMMSVIEQYRMNIPLFLPSKLLLAEWQSVKKPMMNEIYSHFSGDTLPPHPSQQQVPDPNIRNSTRSIRHWTQLSDWYTTLPHVILYTSFADLVLQLNRTILDELRQVSRRMAEHNARVVDQLHDEWRDILLKVARNSPNHPR